MQRQNIPSLYNGTLARERVEEAFQRRGERVQSQAVSLGPDIVLQDLRVVEEKDPRFYRIVRASDNKPYTFRIAGVLSFMDFPLTKPLPVNDRLRHRSQVAALTGFGAPGFESAVSKLREVYIRLRRAMPEGALQPLHLTNRDGEAELVFKCRYFTVGADANKTSNVPIPPAVDYKGVISTMIKKKGVRYAEGNRVAYLEAKSMENNGNVSYKPLSPISFRAGDIVEVEFTVVGVPLADGEVKCLLTQQSVILLDDSLSLDAEMAEEEAQFDIGQGEGCLKRKGSFEDEDGDVRATRHAVAHMTLKDSVTKEMDTRA